jgi:hypothetical protein
MPLFGCAWSRGSLGAHPLPLVRKGADVTAPCNAGDVGLVSDLDHCAAVLEVDGGETYEVAISVAQVAERHAGGSSRDAMAAAMIRDVFATWVEQMHAPADAVYGDSHDVAFAAHEQISVAIRDWRSGGRDNVADFALRWAARVGPIDTTWLQQPASPLLVRSKIRRRVDRLRHIFR